MSGPATPVLLVPGYTNGGPRHWMTFWERANPAWVRMRQEDWENTSPDTWGGALAAALATLPAPALVIAHSLGCITVAHHAARGGRGIAGAFLVAPADVELAPDLPMLRTFAPIPRGALPFPAAVIASTDDPYASFARSQEFATSWGAEFHGVGAKGHLNSDSNLGLWPEGQALLQGFRRRAALANSGGGLV